LYSCFISLWTLEHCNSIFVENMTIMTSEAKFQLRALNFWPLKAYIFLVNIKFPINGYITRPYWFGAQNSFFGLWRLIFAFLTPKTIYFLHLYKISNRLMGHMTYFIFEPPSPQPRDPADSKFFWAKNTQHQITKYFAFLDFWNIA
jgi:hypothetical protein